MCGISGIWNRKLAVEVVESRVTLMSGCMVHRGPDDNGVERVARVNSGSEATVVVFGHRRLSILDTSSAGHQPMLDSNTGNWITYNGEIYNFVEIRSELELLGCRFVSSCDTEVILKAYAEWGVGCWSKLKGIFAFALWDSIYQELHLVRDHLGVKPLYYTSASSEVAFASEVRALLEGSCADRRLSLEGLESYLRYGSVQEPCTLIVGINALPAGSFLTCEIGGARTIRTFWRMDECVRRNLATPSSPKYVLNQLENAVRRQMIADVPVGVFLSGGIDSACVAALAAKVQPGNVKTFCIGSDIAEFDESADAARTATFLGCHHTNLVLEGRLVKESWLRAIDSYDQPSFDGLNTYFISLLVREAGMKVALSGLGGDELFVGYSGFKKAIGFQRASGLLSLVPAGLRRHAGTLLAGLSTPGDAAFGALIELLDHDTSVSYFASRLLFSKRHTAQLLDIRPSGKLAHLSSWESREQGLTALTKNMTSIDRVSFLEMQTYMLSTLLRDSDQLSMAHGLELRVPLIDPDLVEYILPIPSNKKMEKGRNKLLLADALSKLVPPDLLIRRKRGFVLPLRQWLAKDFGSTLADQFSSGKPRGPWNQEKYKRVWDDFTKRKVSWSRVFALFILENWLERNRITTQ